MAEQRTFNLQTHYTRAAYGFMAVPLLFMLVFILYPMVASVGLSFFHYDIIGEARFAGFGNYSGALEDPRFWNAMGNSVTYLLIVPVIQLASLCLALLVNQQVKGVTLFRALYFLPVITPMIVVSLAWRWIFQSDGVLNYLLLTAGILDKPFPFLASMDYALYSTMFVTLWTGIGYFMMIYLAGLQGLPGEVFEAARMDGAGPWTTLWRVLIPLMKPYVLFCSIMSTIGALSVFTEVYAITGGGPARASQTMGLLIYETAFTRLQFGYAAALSVLLSLAILIVTAVNLWLSRRGGVEGYES